MRSRRGSGEGTTEKLPSGLYRGSISIDGRRIKGPAAKTKSQALTLLRAKISQEVREVQNQSFMTLAREWVANRQNLSPTTREVYNWWVDSLKKDPLGKLPVSEVDEQALTEWRDRQMLSPVTIKKRLGFIKTVLKSQKIVLDVPPPPTQRGLRRPLTIKEREELLERLRNAPEDVRIALLLCFHMGLSRSEACGLMFEDYEDGWVWIRRSTVETEKAIHVKATKTNNRVRHIKVPPTLKPHFEANHKGFVLGEGNTPMSPHLLSNKLRYLLEGSSLERVPGMGTHALRRTYGMMLLEAGVDLITASELMGHDPTMLAKIYARSRDDLKEQAVDKTFGAA